MRIFITTYTAFFLFLFTFSSNSFAQFLESNQSTDHWVTQNNRLRKIDEALNQHERKLNEGVDSSYRNETNYYMQKGVSTPHSAQLNTTPFPTTNKRVLKAPASTRPVGLRYTHEDIEELDRFVSFEIQVKAGRRVDDIKFDIAGDSGGSNPNILSELTWSDIKSRQIQGEGRVTIHDKIVLDGKIAYGQIYEGDVQDSDYAGDNRTSEFSRSYSESNDGSTFDTTFGLGYKLLMGDEMKYLYTRNLELILMGGYSYHEQNLTMTNGIQAIPFSAPFSDLDSRYETEWKGPWVGLELSGEKDRFDGAVKVEYHFADYYAQADWNLRTDFAHPKSFEHLSEGNGLVFNFGGNYHVNDSWSFDIQGAIQNWSTQPGVDRTFFANGTSIETRLNEANWNSHEVMLGGTFYY